jgi:two-component sensor histidine kinase
MIAARTFPKTPTAVTHARRFVLEALGEVGPDVADNAAVMVSELATNSVRHAASQFTVTIDRTADEIRVSVDDDGAGLPMVKSPPPAEPTGRGLRIVGALADAWGVTPHAHGPGKSVWFTLATGTPRAAKRDSNNEFFAEPREPEPARVRRRPGGRPSAGVWRAA